MGNKIDVKHEYLLLIYRFRLLEIEVPFFFVLLQGGSASLSCILALTPTIGTYNCLILISKQH